MAQEIVGLRSAYQEALRRRGGNMTVSANLVVELVEQYSVLQEHEARLTAEIKKLRAAENNLNNAYIRVRTLVDAFQTPHAPTPEQVYEHTESRIKALIAIKDAAVNLANTCQRLE